MLRRCYLKCLESSHEDIQLPHNIETVVGRSKTTKIKDQSCSRKQLSLIANCEDCTVEIKQLGVNASGFNGFAMLKDAVYNVSHGTKIEILFNKYYKVLEFDPPPEDFKTPSHKRKLSEDKMEFKKCKLAKVEEDFEINIASESIWESIDKGELYVFTSKGVKSSDKIAAFDMDGTLIKTKSGKVHPVDTKDWDIAFNGITKKLKEYQEKQYKVVIMSNQAPLGKGRVKIEDFKIKIEKLVEKLDVPVQAYFATGKGIYRKPTIGMWKTLIKKKNDGIKPDLTQCFYCGDAAGRSVNWAPGKKKDHSMADKLLAENLGITFYTPEQFFLGHSISNVPFTMPEFIPDSVKAEEFNENLISKDKEILVLVGYPGSGKSFLAQQINKKSKHQYVAVCRDKLGTWQKCAAEATKLLQQGKSVIVDSTNPDMESRARWTSLAKERGVSCRCVSMTTSFAHARHNNKFRELMKFDHLPVNDMIFYSYKKKFQEPTISEGFLEVIEANFNPYFEDQSTEKLYRMHLLEK